MAKKKNRRKSSIIPMLAVGIGVYLLIKYRDTVVIGPVKPMPQLNPKSNEGGAAIQTRPDRRRYINTYI